MTAPRELMNPGIYTGCGQNKARAAAFGVFI